MEQQAAPFEKMVQEAVLLNDRKNKLCGSIIRQIGSPSSKHSPNQSVTAVAKTFVFSGAKLSGQIIDAVRIGHLLIAVIGLRPLFELLVNSTYVFNHPRHKKSFSHMRRVCKNILRLTNKKRRVTHTRIDGKSLEQRTKEVKLLHLYKTTYRSLSDWSHIMLRTPYISVQKEGEKFGVKILSTALCLMNDVIDAIRIGLDLQADAKLETDLVSFRDKCSGLVK